MGTLVGLSADIVKLLSNYIMYSFKLTPVVFWQLTATRFLSQSDLHKPIAYLIGGVADLTISALLGVIFVYALYYTGKDYLWIKGVGFGLLVWVNLFGTLLGESVIHKLPQKPSSIVVTIVAHLVFGLALAYFAQRFYQREESEV